MADLLDLAKFMHRFGDRSLNLANKVAQEAAKAIIRDLVQVTPVDTGAALSNWEVTLGAPSQGILSTFWPSPKGRMIKGKWVHTVDPSITFRVNADATATHAWTVIMNKQPGIDLFITNNIPYIQALNNGTSSQAPAGFVDRAIILGNQVASRARLTIL